MILTREQLVKPIELKTERLTIEQFGGDVFIRQLSTSEKTDKIYMWANRNDRNRSRQFARWIVMCLVDESGKRLLEDSDIDTVATWPASLVEALSDACAELNTGDAVDLKKKSSNSGPIMNGSGT